MDGAAQHSIKAGSLPDFGDWPVSVRTPSYRLHKPSSQAVVTLSGRDYYLGRYNAPESRAAYDRLIAEWLASGRRLGKASPASGPDLTINELLLAYLQFANGYYVKNGKPTSEPKNICCALRPLRQLYGHTFAKDFGPSGLKMVRQAMIDSDLCRSEINKRIGRIVRAFKWAVESEMTPPSIHQALKAVSGLRRGRSNVRESEPVKPVPESDVEAISPYVSRQVWAMVELQRRTGMRPGEVCIMRTTDLDTKGKIWVYTPENHKTEHHGKRRFIYLGPKAQAILRPWLRSDPLVYLFSPKEAMAEFQVARALTRKTKRSPSEIARKKPRRKKRPLGDRYATTSYAHSIATACCKAGVQHWHPNQLRHAAATWLRKEFGLDVARVILGHSSPAVTEVYAELDREKAITVMERVG